MSKNTLLKQRYEIKEILGQGGVTTTYLALDLTTNRQCVIKCLSFRKIEEWKTYDLFERETKILKNLEHPQIPDYIDFFTIETEHDVEHYLVQEYVEGRTLKQLVQEKKHFTEQELIKIAVGIVRILEYLHEFSPPIIHRDIKPSNIIVSPYHRSFLIDFGAVRDTIREDTQMYGGGSTIVGTYGYMPLEQFEGRAVPASDFFSLGMTLIYVLSHKDPLQMKKQRLRLNFRPYVNISNDFARVLERMIAPDWQARYQSASKLRHDLERLLRPVKVTKFPIRRLATAAVSLLLVIMGVGLYTFFSLQTSKEIQQKPPIPSVSKPSISQKPPSPVKPLFTPVPIEGCRNIIQNGDFSQGLTHWKLNVNKKGEITVKVIDSGTDKGKVLFIERLRSGADGTYSGVFQQLNLPLKVVKKLVLEAELKPEMQTLNGTGWFGGEYPAGVRIRVSDPSYSNGSKLWFVGLYTRGSNRYDNLFLVPVGQWTKVRQDLTGTFPETATLNYLQVIGSGWDYRSFADNIALYVEEE